MAEENIRTVARLQNHSSDRRSPLERIGDGVAAFAAKEVTVVLHLLWFAVWLLLNAGVIPRLPPFDPFPFTLLTTVVSLEAIFLTLFVLASQNRMTLEADRRAQLDLQVNLLAEQEMTLVLQMLREICDHLGLQHTTSSGIFRELVRPTDVQQLAERLDEQLSPANAHTAAATRDAAGKP